MNKTDQKTNGAIISWLQKFAEMVRSNNYSNAESLFDKSVFGFGTIAKSYSNLAEYKSRQWQCWGTTKKFDFDYSSLNCVNGDNDNLIVIGILWTSIGVKPDGAEFPREGRATIVFERNKETGSLVSIHNHYSRTPKNFPEDF